MDKVQLLFESSPWWIPVCLLLGLGYAVLLYQKQGPWSKRTNQALAVLRGLLVAVIAFLLINPLLRQIFNEVEDPIYVIAVDNSQSVLGTDGETMANEIRQSIYQIHSSITESEAQSAVYTLDDSDVIIDSIHFDNAATNISSLLRNIENDFEGRNLAGVVLISDGIFNQGISPDYRNYAYPIYTIGLGDTIPKKDLKVKNLLYNQVAYQGNQFPLIVEVQNDGYASATSELRVEKNGETITTERVAFTGPGVQRIDFTIDAKTSGFQRYTVVLETLEDEFLPTNNALNAYLEVIEGKEKILIAAPAPHPDIKAISASLSKNQNYEVSQFIVGIDEMPEGPVDLVIMHEAFDRSRKLSRHNEALSEKSDARLLILSARSNFNLFNSETDIADFTQKRGQKDQVTPALNDNFTAFTVSSKLQNIVNAYPPLSVPYGDFQINANSDVLFYQRVGSITTDKPLIILQKEQEKKTGVIIGEGIWQWRLQEFAQEENTDVFDEIISKLVQYLSTKEDKRRFRFAPEKNEYFDTEPVVFSSEVYNEIYEPVYGYEINISLTSEKGEKMQYSYTNSPTNSMFAVGQLAPGIYKYAASTMLDDRRATVTGEINVKELQLESISLTARHNLLRNISQTTGGGFYLPNNEIPLVEELSQRNAKGVIYTTEKFESIINIKVIFFLIMVLLSTEWFIRKYNGSY